MYIDLVNWLFI